jgi:hypothetical protein
MGQQHHDSQRLGRWSQCAHCFIFYVGDHYCGAPWQHPPIGEGLDEIAPARAASVGKFLFPPTT